MVDSINHSFKMISRGRLLLSYRKAGLARLSSSSSTRGQQQETLETTHGINEEDASSSSYPVKKDTRKFISFFDEVDAYMAEGKSQNQNTTASTHNRNPSNSSGLDRSAIVMTDPVSGKSRSILDSFPIPSNVPQSENADTFDKNAYQEYVGILEDIDRESKKRGGEGSQAFPAISKWLRSESRLRVYHLPALDRSIADGGVNPSAMELRDDLEKQRIDFIEKLSIDEEAYEFAKLVLTRIGRLCAKRAKSRPLEIAWEKVKEAGMLLKNDTLGNYLYVVSTYPSMSLSMGPLESIFDVLETNTEVTSFEDKDTNFKADKKSLKNDISEEIAAFNDIIYAPTDQTTSIRVKALVKKGNAKDAEKLVNDVSVDFFNGVLNFVLLSSASLFSVWYDKTSTENIPTHIEAIFAPR